MYILYLLRCSDGSLYTGIAKDLGQRLAAHRNGSGSKYVRARLPCSVVYTESCADRSAALRREYEVKKLSKAEKEFLIDKQ